MKKTIALVLCLLMVVSLAACGGQVSGVDESTASTEETETTIQDAEETEQTETDATEETGSTETITQEKPVIYTLDTVPKPVMEEMSSMTDGDTVEYASRFPSKSHQELADYLALLETAGFTVTIIQKEEGTEEGGYIYEAEATNENASVYIYYEWSTPPEGTVMRETGIFDVVITVEPVNVNADVSLDEFTSLIPTLPDVKWTDSDGESKVARWKHYYTSHLDMDGIAEYVNSLKESGYTVDIEEAPDGNEDYDVYYFSACNQDGVEVQVKITAPDDECLMTTISVGVKK